MASITSKKFGFLFRELRLRSGISTLKEFGNLLVERGYAYEDSIFSHWQNGNKVPKQRKIVISILGVFRTRSNLITIDSCNELLESANQGYLTENEIKALKLIQPILSNFLVPPKIQHFIGRETELGLVLDAVSKYKIIQICGQAGVRCHLPFGIARTPSLFFRLPLMDLFINRKLEFGFTLTQIKILYTSLRLNSKDNLNHTFISALSSLEESNNV